MNLARCRSASVAAALALCVLGGCATAPAGGAATAATAAPAEPAAAPRVDPWERWNRMVFEFNDALDEAVLKPVATAYRDVVPKFARTGVDNVFGNLYDAWSVVNHLLQGKLQGGSEMGARVLANTVLGLFGLFDPASEMGLTRRSEDFGQTMGVWGLPDGPFLMLPLFGPSTLRDAVGFWVDRQVSPAQLTDSSTARWSIAAMEVINLRTNLLQTTRLLDEVALDRYTFIRDAYLARRRDALYDGAPPLEDAGDDWEDEPPAPAPQTPR